MTDDNKMYPDSRRPKETADNKILFCTEVPTAHLDEVHPLIDWHFVIATECRKDPKYLEWYANRPRDAKIMLDNGMFEEGKPLDPDELCDIALQLHPEVVFAPDQVGSMVKTLNMTGSFIDLCRQINAPWDVGVIPQGKDPWQVVMCHDRMLREFEFDGPIGISFLNDRRKVVNIMNAGNRWSPVRWYHFLGMYDVCEIPTWPKHVRSMDTIKPFKAAMHGYKLEDCPRGLGKWNTTITMPKEHNDLMYENYMRMQLHLRR